MIPALLHFIWIQKKPFGYQEYICLKSALKNTQYQIFLHTNLKPGEAGLYCPYAIQNPRFILDYQPYSLEYRGVTLRAATLSDILRIQILQTYGGIYSDLDMLWLNPIPFDLSSVSLLATWENQSYKILTNSVLASCPGYNFSELLNQFHAILDSFRKKNIVNLSGETLKEHLTLFKPTGDFFKEKADLLLKKKYFQKNNWRTLWKFLHNEIPEEKIVLHGICGIHLCGCGLFGKFKCDTSLLLTKHSGLKKICDSLMTEEEQAQKNSEFEEE